MTEPLRFTNRACVAGAASEPHQVSDPGYALPKALRALSDCLWQRLATDLVLCAKSGAHYSDLQRHPLYLLTAAEFSAGMLTGQPNPDRFFLPALHEELDRAGVPPSAVHPSLGYAPSVQPAPQTQPPKG